MACKLQVKTDFYVREKDVLSDFSVDQTIVIKEKFLKSICESYSRDTENEFTLDEWYAYVNSYYPYTEDVDAFARVSHLLATKPSFVSLTSSDLQSITRDIIPHSERSAQLEYLESNPVSFIILGKPGIGEEELGRQLAEYWNCVYINPEVLIEQEIESGSRAGECIEFNLRCGRAVGIDIILRLIEKRVKSETAKHRGFVLCGMPLVPNELYQEDPISSESAVFTVKEIFEEVFEATIEIGVPPTKPHVSISSKYKSDDDEVEDEEEKDAEGKGEEAEEVPPPLETELPQEPPIPIDVGPDYDVCEPPDISTNYENQLNFLFDLMKPPFIIIYIMCPTPDVIGKRDSYRFDVYSGQSINLQTERCNRLLFNYFSRQEGIDVEEIPEEFFETSYIGVDSSSFQHLVRLPRHFPANVASQLDTFHYTGLRFIERRVLVHDPQYFLKVDGRANVQRMFHMVKSRVNILPLQKVLVPAKLNVMEEIADVGEGGPLPEFKPEGLSFEECFREFCKRQVASIIFKWRWSDWGTKCPVAMSDGIYRNGNPSFAVRFMNKMFFLSDEDAFLRFYRNPRPFLLPPLPKPSSKVFIFGPKYSGRSEVAMCLGYYLNATVASLAEMLEHFIEQREEEIKEKIRQAAVVEAMRILNKRRIEEAKLMEQNRIAGMRDWLAEVVSLAEQLVTLLSEWTDEETVTTFELSSFRLAMRKVSVKEAETETTIAMNDVRDRLEALSVPMSHDSDHWQALLDDKIKFLYYLPNELRTRIDPVPATIFDEFVIEYAENAVANANIDRPELNTKNLVDVVTSNIKTIEESNVEEGNKSGWIVDGMLCNLNLIEELYTQCMADEIIVLKDQDDFEFLINKYKENPKSDTDFREYRNFFIHIGRPDAAWRCPSEISTKSYKTRLVHELLYEILEDETAFYDADVMDKETKLQLGVDAYRQELIRFRDNYEDVKEFFLEHDMEPLEIEVTNKTIPKLMEDVVIALENKYKVKAFILTEEDRAEEINDILSLFVSKDVGEGGGGPANSGEDLLEKHRRFGETYCYCPVTFHDKWVLWKGKEEFAVKFQDKVYLLCNEEDMNQFLISPRTYLSDKAPSKFPPPRLCVVGIPGLGKTTLSKNIADNFGLVYLSFESLLKKAFNILSPYTLDELRREDETDDILSDYLNSVEPLPEELLESIINNIWFDYPIKECGFVLDDFPKRVSDVDFMVKNKLIPDIIIHMTGNELDIKTRLLDDQLNIWEAEMEEKRLQSEEEQKQAIEEWEIQRKKRFEELIDERREIRYAEKRRERAGSPSSRDEGTDKSEIRTGSQVSFDSVAEQEDIDEANRIVDMEFPELVFESSLETLEEATERFDSLISDVMAVESVALKSIKESCQAELVPFEDVICDLEYFDITKRKVFLLIDPIKFRTNSHFERCYDVSVEVGERLLESGYFFLSKFGKTCPVQYYENKNPIQMYIPMEQFYEVFPIIHRSFIYYVVGTDNQQMFKRNPMKYVNVDEVNFPLIPLKVAVTGPPKCGKTILAQRIKNEWGFKYVSRGLAARYVLTYLPLSNLAKNMESVLRKGWEMTDEMVAKCIEAACLDSRAVTQGIVFDGFPNTISEVRHLSYVGMVPNLVIDLQATSPEVFECLSNDVGRRGFPRYSDRFIEHILTEWTSIAKDFRNWFDREYQVTARIPIKTSNWSVLSQSKEYILAVFSEIKHYYIHISEDWPLRLANMQVTPLEFLERQGCYKTYCPCCLHFSNVLTSGGEPPDRTGLVQFRKYFYWLCPKHIEKFLKRPEAYIPPYNNHKLPQYLPVILHLTELPDNLFEGGKCIVCFKRKRLIVKGNIAFAVGYINLVYLFDTMSCLMEFMKNPMEMAGEIDFNPPDNYPELLYKQLPPLGMLEQYVSKPITKALSFVSRRRPVIPGLSIQASAAIGMGLFLKVNFAKISPEYKPYYLEADELYHERRNKLVNYLESMKSFINPYLHYEEPMPAFEIPPSVRTESTESINTAVSKIVSEIVDNAIYD